MKMMTPAEVLKHWLDTDKRVNEEVARVVGMLTERRPGTCKAVHFSHGNFSISYEGSPDEEFLELVAQKFRENDWEASVEHDQDIGGDNTTLVLGSSVLSEMPEPKEDDSWM